MTPIFRTRFLFNFVVWLTISLLSVHFLTVVHAGTDTTFVDEARIRCPNDHVPVPFANIYFCDSVDLPCAGASTVFTWYATDTSINDSYARATVFFTSQNHPASTSGLVSRSTQHNLLPIWQQIHQKHHDAIAYALIDGESRLLTVTQFEFLPNQLDNGIPKAGVLPIHARQWVIMVGVNPYHVKKDMRLFRLTELSLFNTGKHQGVLVDASAHLDSNSMFKAQYPLVSLPSVQQSPAQRWLCQGYFSYSSQGHDH